jgi:Cu/Ag efflux protein CusF
MLRFIARTVAREPAPRLRVPAGERLQLEDAQPVRFTGQMLGLSRKTGLLLVVSCAAGMLGACDRAAEIPAAGTREYDVRGIVRGISPDRGTIEIQHEAIPGFMPAMTMPFSVKDPALVKDVNVADAVEFRIRATTAEATIEKIRTIDAGQVKLDTSPAPAR